MNQIMDYADANWTSWLFAALVPVTGYIYFKVMAIMRGVRALLRDRILYAYNHYTEKEYYPIYARENVEDMYNRYHALGGNGTATDLVEKLKELPTEKEEEE